LFTILAPQNLLCSSPYRKFLSSNSMRRISSRKLRRQEVYRRFKPSSNSKSGGTMKLEGLRKIKSLRVLLRKARLLNRLVQAARRREAGEVGSKGRRRGKRAWLDSPYHRRKIQGKVMGNRLKSEEGEAEVEVALLLLLLLLLEAVKLDTIHFFYTVHM
jgi:hypothetical protein